MAVVVEGEESATRSRLVVRIDLGLAAAESDGTRLGYQAEVFPKGGAWQSWAGWSSESQLACFYAR